MFSIQGWDRFKLYEGETGCLAYLERAVRKVINGRQRAYCRKLSVDGFMDAAAQADEPVILSLTSFPARIDYVYLAVKSLLNQTVKPERIILWLAKNQFENVEIPEKLLALQAYGLEIRYCDEDILGHKKYYYAMREFPDHVIVTYDDDLIYPEDSLENLLLMHKQLPQAIICNRGKQIMFSADGEIEPYAKWKLQGDIEAGTPSYRIMASTGAGTLYPPNCMPEETFDIERIRDLALTADDLWMKVMSIKGGVPVVKTRMRWKALCASKNRQEITLAHQNVDQHRNDHIMHALLACCPDVRQTLLEETRKT